MGQCQGCPTIDIGYAGTDYKHQGKTRLKLVLAFGPRRFPPYFTLSTVHVLASRVKLGLQLRVIGFDPQRDPIDHLTSLQHPPCLGIWESSYDRSVWNEQMWHAAIIRAMGGSAPVDVFDEDDGLDDDDFVAAAEWDAMEEDA